MAEEINELQLVAFEMGNETYGVDISCVNEIIRMQEITRVPRTPEFVEGVINLRGRVIPVIDLRKRFGLEQIEETQNSRIIVVEVDNVTVGMIVDAVSEVLRLSTEQIDPPPPIFAGIDTDFIKGIGKMENGLIIILDLNQVLYKREKEELRSFEEEIKR